MLLSRHDTRQWARHRKAGYEDAGWNVEGGPKVRDKDRRPKHRPTRQPALPYQKSRVRSYDSDNQATPEYNYRQRRCRREKQLRWESKGQITLEQIADRDFLVDCFRQLQQEGGPAPGIDGISPQAMALAR